MPLNNICRIVTALSIITFSSSLYAQFTKTGLSHCRRGERIQFSCRIGVKMVSLCGGGVAGPLKSLIYRYGTLGKIENEYIAHPDNTNRFFGSVAPANPGASISQVWFEKGEMRYLLTECIGGNCPRGGGLAVLRRDRVLMNVPCNNSEKDNFASFSNELVEFTSRVKTSRSATELLTIEEAGIYDVNELFPTRGDPRW